MKHVKMCSIVVTLLATSLSAPAWAQEPGVDEEGCKESTLLSRMPGCGIYECSSREFDEAEIVINMAGETKRLEGEVEEMKLVCPSRMSPLQLQRNVEGALKKAGYSVLLSGALEGEEHPVVSVRKGSQWLTVRTGMFNEFPTYELVAVRETSMTQDMTAGAQEIADALSNSGRLDVYGITFATGQAGLTPESEQVLSSVLEVLKSNPEWKLRIEGHTDNVGDPAANQTLSQARAAAVVAWLTSRGIGADRLSAAGFGASEPVDSNDTDGGRARNRRVVLVKR